MEELSAAVRQAVHSGKKLRIRGHGSKDFYGQHLHGEVIDLSAYRGIVDYEPTELVITARAGTPITEIETALAEAGQMLAFEPPRFAGWGTIGGAIATGLSGPRRPYAGAARDFILGSRLLDGRGSDLTFGGQVIKNVAGFDVSRLMVGAMGTLGALLEVSLKTLPRPGAEVTLRFAMAEAAAIGTMNEWAGRPLPISAACCTEGGLTVRLSGAASAIKAAQAKLGGEAMTDGEAFWNGVRDQTNNFFAATATLWRISLPSATPPLNLGAAQFIDWGGALRWIAGEQDTDVLRKHVQGLGGHATLFRTGFGNHQSAPVFQPLAPGLAVLHKRLKHVFDPHGIFNPGRMYDFER